MPPAVAERTERPTQPAAVPTWNVMVRHSPLLLRSADIEAPTPEAAKREFLRQAKEKHAERAARSAKDTRMDATTIAHTQAVIRNAYERAVEADQRGELTWVIRPADEVKAERESIKRQQTERWAPPALAGK